MLAVISRWFLFFAVVAFSTISAAEKKYGPGVSDTEIKIGQTMAYSGPASALGTLGKAEMAYFKKVNDEGGVNGRRIKFISLDDGYSPPKTVEQTRKLVELEEVLLLFSSLGTAHNSSVHRYLNAKQVPQLFIASSGLKWNSPGEFRWTMAATPSPRVDMPLYAKYLLRSKPAAKIGVLYQNDDFGKDNLKALKEALGDKAPTMILSETTYEATDPTVDSQIVTLKGANVDVVFILASPKAAAQAIRGWRANGAESDGLTPSIGAGLRGGVVLVV